MTTRASKARRAAFIVLLGAAAAACVIVLGLRWYEERGKLRVVKTWGELLRAPEHDLGDGVKVRLGIEGRECPTWSGVMVYCMMEGYEDPGRSESGDMLGPVHVCVRHDEHTHDGKPLMNMPASTEKSMPLGSRLLFARFIPVAAEEVCAIHVRSDEDALLATAVIRVTASDKPPWIPWNDAERLQANKLTRHVANPACITWLPLRIEYLRKPTLDPRELLPSLQAFASDSTLTIEKVGDVIELRSTLDEMTGDWLHVLARWWVNGVPFVPEEEDSLTFRYVGQKPFAQIGRTIHLSFHPDPALGGKTGDRIALEILYCPLGWDLAGPGEKLHHMPLSNEISFPRLSNRIEFTAP